MEVLIRQATKEEYSNVIELTWKTFLEFEAPDYSQQGINQFKKDIVDSTEFKNKCLSGENIIFGAFINNKLVGILALRNVNHICLAFVSKEYHRKGIGSELFKYAVNYCKSVSPSIDKITVNSSPFAIPFYKSLGFSGDSEEQVINGIRFTPMTCKV